MKKLATLCTQDTRQRQRKQKHNICWASPDASKHK